MGKGGRETWRMPGRFGVEGTKALDDLSPDLDQPFQSSYSICPNFS